MVTATSPGFWCPCTRGRAAWQSLRPHGAAEDVSFGVTAGEVFGVIASNGTGKTTAVECFAGYGPDSGAVPVLGLDRQRDRAALWRA